MGEEVDSGGEEGSVPRIFLPNPGGNWGTHWRVEIHSRLGSYFRQHRIVGISVDEGLRLSTTARHHHQRGQDEGTDRSYDRHESQPHRRSYFELRLREGTVEEELNCSSLNSRTEINILIVFKLWLIKL